MKGKNILFLEDFKYWYIYYIVYFRIFICIFEVYNIYFIELLIKIKSFFLYMLNLL